MKPSEISKNLKSIASYISDTENPSRSFIIGKLRHQLSAMKMDPIVKIWWSEPDNGSETIQLVDASEADVNDIINWAKKEAGTEWGTTIPGIRLQKSTSAIMGKVELMPLASFADSIRYSTGEGIYSSDCPEFSAKGIERS
jgi:hypothetical protein